MRRRCWPTAGALLAALALAGCVSETVRSVDMSPTASAERALPEDLLLDVGVAVLDPNVPEDWDDRTEQAIATDVREAEAHYLAYQLKQTLQGSGNWGAVRVLPRPSHAVDVNVHGTILHSDGERLILRARVTDATGAPWFDREYEALASKYAYDEALPPDFDPFQPVYRAIHDDMLEVLEGMDIAAIRAVRQVAEMRFARAFAPDAFAAYLGEDNGRWSLRRLPAEDDPMLVRTRRIREREYLFVDTLDEYFATFREGMRGPYDDWRKASYEEAIALRELRNEERSRMILGAVALAGGIAAASSSNSSGSAIAGHAGILGGSYLLKSAFDRRMESRIHIEALQELGQSLEAELAPRVVELENRTVTLTGTVDEQYTQWRRLLRELYYTEQGLPLPADAGDNSATADG